MSGDLEFWLSWDSVTAIANVLDVFHQLFYDSNDRTHFAKQVENGLKKLLAETPQGETIDVILSEKAYNLIVEVAKIPEVRAKVDTSIAIVLTRQYENQVG